MIQANNHMVGRVRVVGVSLFFYPVIFNSALRDSLRFVVYLTKNAHAFLWCLTLGLRSRKSEARRAHGN